VLFNREFREGIGNFAADAPEIGAFGGRNQKVN